MSDQIDVNQLSNALQQKVDLPSGKSQADIDYVVEFQLPTSSNNYTWYRLYKSGWIEQGGITSQSNTYALKTIHLPKEMADTNYYATSKIQTLDTSWYTNNSTTFAQAGGTDIAGSVTNKTTTTFDIQSYSIQAWEVKGMSSQS